jgi:hypothetical protein
MRNSVDHATVFFALQSLGAVATPFNFRFKPAGVAYVLEDSEAVGSSSTTRRCGADLERIHPPSRDLLWVASGATAEGVLALNMLVRDGDPGDRRLGGRPSGLMWVIGRRRRRVLVVGGRGVCSGGWRG